MKIIAEISANHNGTLLGALELIEAAATTGADYVKFQTFKPSQMVADQDYMLKDGLWAGKKLIDLYKQAQTPWEWHEELFRYARKLGIEPISSPFSEEAVDFLEMLDCSAYKIASFEMIDLKLIRKVARTGKPLIISTGMASRNEVSLAVSVAKSEGCTDITLMQCTSSYPANENDANLATMVDMKKFGAKVGLSDHTLGHKVAMVATALGATIIEKHITLNKSVGLDADFSMEPKEFKEMIEACRSTKNIIGQVKYIALEAESNELRRSLYFTEAITRGSTIEDRHIKTARPALGLHPFNYNKIIGKQVTEDVKANQPITSEVIYAIDIK